MRPRLKWFLTAALAALMTAPTLGQPIMDPFIDETPFVEIRLAPSVLLRNKGVQKEIDLTEGQRDKVDKIHHDTFFKDYLPDIQKASAAGDLKKIHRLVQKYILAVEEKVNKAVPDILQEEQIKRLKQIELQVNTLQALNKPDIQKKLKLTDKQKKGMREIMDGFKQSHDEAWKTFSADVPERSEEREQKAADMAQTSIKLKDEANQKALGTLTSEQKSTWEDMTGKKFEYQLDIARPALSAQQPRLRATLKGHSYLVRSVPFSPDGKTLASCSEKMINLWNVADGKSVATLKVKAGHVEDLAFSPDGKTLASVVSPTAEVKRWESQIKLWDLASGKDKTIFQDREKSMGRVRFSPDGKILAWVSTDDTVKLWDIAGGKVKTALKGDALPTSIAFGPDGNSLAVGSVAPNKKRAGMIELWDMASSKKRATLKGDSLDVWTVAFSPDGKMLASGTAIPSTGGPPAEIKLWDVASGKNVATLTATRKGKQGYIKSVTFSPDGKILASLAAKEGIKLWDVASGKEKASLKDEDDNFTSMAFSPDGKILAVGSYGEIQLWELPAVKKAR